MRRVGILLNISPRASKSIKAILVPNDRIAASVEMSLLPSSVVVMLQWNILESSMLAKIG